MANKPTLAQLRIQKLLSAYELAKKAEVAASTILDIENGAKPRLSTIRKLSTALECQPSDIDWPGDPLGVGREDDDEG
jgi:DNA-binding Xre family transcriptional regulator